MYNFRMNIPKLHFVYTIDNCWFFFIF